MNILREYRANAGVIGLITGFWRLIDYVPESGSGGEFLGVTTEVKLSFGFIFTSLICCYQSSALKSSSPSNLDLGDFFENKTRLRESIASRSQI